MLTLPYEYMGDDVDTVDDVELESDALDSNVVWRKLFDRCDPTEEQLRRIGYSFIMLFRKFGKTNPASQLLDTAILWEFG